MECIINQNGDLGSNSTMNIIPLSLLRKIPLCLNLRISFKLCIFIKPLKKCSFLSCLRHSPNLSAHISTVIG